MLSGAVPFSTHAIMASRTSWRVSLKPGTEWIEVPRVAAWLPPAKYQGAFTFVGVFVQCLGDLVSLCS